MTWRLSRLTRPLRGDQFGLDWPSSLPWTSRSVWRGPGDQFAVDSVSSLVWETQLLGSVSSSTYYEIKKNPTNTLDVDRITRVPRWPLQTPPPLAGQTPPGRMG